MDSGVMDANTMDAWSSLMRDVRRRLCILARTRGIDRLIRGGSCCAERLQLAATMKTRLHRARAALRESLVRSGIATPTLPPNILP